jgi:hypothetical protein
MAQLSFALYEAHLRGSSVELLAGILNLPDDFVAQRIEAARLCLVMGGGVSTASVASGRD